MALPLRAQDSTVTPPVVTGAASGHSSAFFSRGNVVTLGAFALGTVLIAPYDRRWTSQLQRIDLQSNRRLGRSADVIRTLGDPGSLILSGSLFAIGRLSRRPGLTDAGLHATEAVLMSGLLTTVLKGVVGRARPHTVQNSDAGAFHLGRGFQGGYTSMPSGHTTVAFAAAASLGSELGRSHQTVARFVTPLLYTMATAVGVSRLYDDKHWATDIVVGAAVGTLVGRRVVEYTHATPSSRWNRWRLPVAVGVGSAGESTVQLHFEFR